MNYELNEKEKNDIIIRSFKFALRVLNIVKQLPKNQALFIICDQLTRSGTSIGANAEEAKAGFSKQDFIYKMSTASKEARESNYWLRLLRDSNLISNDSDSKLYSDIVDAIAESDEIKKILTSIVKTSKENR